ncbi:MAG: hypothetical protein IJI85_10250 [Clostridia bacterium]|nr:hypothetical protein [Clostridia bacterium]
MKERFLFIAIVIIAAILTALLVGCGHNTVSYGDGIMLETTINPEAKSFGISFRYGKILTVCVRENSEIEMHGGGAGDVKAADAKDATSAAKADGKVTIKIGPQVTGYYVDALKAGAKPEDLKR